MFYSHQLLARKAPLGQIWMAATLHAKMNRKKLNKLNIIKICEEILNPSVPMALRLSGILMGGVVIVYQRKVKLLYDDVTRLLVEINEAWKVKAAADPTVLPKGKRQAKKEAVTLPERNGTDLGEMEQSLNFSNDVGGMGGFQQTAYFAMQLDDVEERFVGNDHEEGDAFQNTHQADAENITLFERFDLYQGNTDTYNRFERFDIEGDEETQTNFPSGDHTQMPTSLIHSPTCQDKPPKVDEIHDQHPEQRANQQSDESKEAQEDQQRQGPLKRKPRRRPAAYAMDYEQTIIPGDLYQSWLQNTSDIVSRGRKRKASTDLLSTMKIANLMELPPSVLMDDLYMKEKRTIYYPAPLLELWAKSTLPPHDLPSARFSTPQPSVSSPQEGVHFHEPAEFPLEDIHNGGSSQSVGISIEKLRANVLNNDRPTEILMEEIRVNFLNNAVRTSEANVMVTPGNYVDDVRSILSSASGHGNRSHSSEVNSGQSNQKRPHSSSRHGSSGLEPVAEEIPWQYPESNFKLSRLSENGLTVDEELLMETGPTQTQPRPPITTPQVDKMTDSIQQQMKMHFETAGAPAVESLLKLAAGLNRKAAAVLFYQTCVLASRDVLRVEQNVPYGDILISKGAKM